MSGLRFGTSPTFSPYNYYNILEGEVSPYHVGFLRAMYYTNPGSLDYFITNCCTNSHFSWEPAGDKTQLKISSIEVIQVGNGWDPDLQDNAFTLDYTPINLNAATHNGYMSVLANTYEGCLVTLMWNKRYSGGTPQEAQIDRVTYTIKRHMNRMGERTTEFQLVKRFTYSYVPTNAGLRSGFWPPCYFNKYYWHPSLKFYFYMDYIDYQWTVIFTCFPYNTQPTKACDADFATTGTPTFRPVALYTTNWDWAHFYGISMAPVFTRGYTYNVFLYHSPWYADGGYRLRSEIRKLVFSGTSCTNYGVTYSSIVYYSSYYDPIRVTQLSIIP